MSDVELAAIGSFFLWTYALMSPLAGMLADRAARSRVILGSLVGWSMVTFATGFVTSAQQLLCTRVVLGIFEAAYLPAAIALIADYHSSKTRATAIGLHATGLAFGVSVGGAGMGYMAEHLGWRAGFFILGLAGMVLAVVVYIMVRDPAPDASERDASIRPTPMIASISALIRIRSFVLIVVASMIIAFGDWTFLNWLPLYFKETFQMSLTSAGFAGTFTLQGAVLLGGVAGSVFSDRVAGKKPRRRMLIQFCSYVIAAPFLAVFFWQQPQLVMLNVCIVIFSCLQGIGACNVSPLLCDLLPSGLRSTAIGLNNLANCLAGGAGIMVAGLLKSQIGLGRVFGGISGTMLVATGVMLICYRFFLRRDLSNSTAID